MKRGFTLIELSIVLVIIGLLVAGIVGGKQLIAQAQLRSVISDINLYKRAFYQFLEKYNYLPGDYPNSIATWGISLGPANNGNGDGNGIVDRAGFASPTTMGGFGQNGEPLYVWFHLTQAGLMRGSYLGSTTGGGQHIPGVNVPTYYKSKGVVYYGWHYSSHYGRTGHALSFSRMTSDNQSVWASAFTAEEVYSIDSKIDTGVATTGNLYAIRADADAGCLDNGFSQPSANYVLGDTREHCRIFIWFDPLRG